MHNLLPFPDSDDVDNFIASYKEQYGIAITEEQALIMLGGAMRFIWLTEIKPQVEAEQAMKNLARLEKRKLRETLAAAN